MKKLLVLLSLMLAISLTACSSSSTDDDTDDTDDTTVYLKGYWVLSDDYSGDDNYSYAFEFDGDDYWNGLDVYGDIDGLCGNAYVEDGYFKMTGILDDEVSYQISDEGLLDDDGEVVYIQYADYTFMTKDELTVAGKWYAMSNPDSYMLLNSDGSAEKYDALYDSTSTGSYTVKEYDTGAPGINEVSIGEDYKTTQVNFDDFFFSSDLTFIANNKALVSSSGDDLYILESARNDSDIVMMANLVARAWEDEEYAQEYDFYGNNAVAYISDTSTFNVDKIGTWQISGDTVTIEFEDGETKTGTMTIEGTYCSLTFDGDSTVFYNKSIWDN